MRSSTTQENSMSMLSLLMHDALPDPVHRALERLASAPPGKRRRAFLDAALVLVVTFDLTFAEVEQLLGASPR
jgi:hypothetical protein